MPRRRMKARPRTTTEIPLRSMSFRLSSHIAHRIIVGANRHTRGNKSAFVELLLDRGLQAWEAEVAFSQNRVADSKNCEGNRADSLPESDNENKPASETGEQSTGCESEANTGGELA